MSFVSELRDELVAAAEREQTRRLPRVRRPAPRLVFAAAATAAMALILVLAVSALNTRPAEDGPPVATPTPEGRDLFGGTLEPGVRYRTRAFVPAVSFEVPEGDWHITDTTATDVLILDRGEPFFEPDGERRPPGALWFTRITQVYDPAVRGLKESLVAAPADLHAWMRAHPDLRVSRSQPVTVAGVPGDRFSVTVRFERPTHDYPECRRRFQVTCSAITRNGWFQDGTLLRVTVLRTEPDPLIIMLEHFTRAGLREMEEAAAPVLRSLRIGVR
jgi:hypothetical protein